MPARKYKTNPAQVLSEGQQIVHSASDAKYRHKVEMVNLVLSGLSPSYLSSYCGDSKRTITLWVKTADEQGFGALKAKKPTGRPPKLTKPYTHPLTYHNHCNSKHPSCTVSQRILVLLIFCTIQKLIVHPPEYPNYNCSSPVSLFCCAKR